MQAPDPSFVAFGLDGGKDDFGCIPVYIGCHLSAERPRRLRTILHVSLKICLLIAYMVVSVKLWCMQMKLKGLIGYVFSLKYEIERTSQSVLKAVCWPLKVSAQRSLSVPQPLVEEVCIIFGSSSKESFQPKCPCVECPMPSGFWSAACDRAFHLDHWIGYCLQQVDGCSCVVQRCYLLQPHLAVLVFSGFIGVELLNKVKISGFTPKHVDTEYFRCSIAA